MGFTWVVTTSTNISLDAIVCGEIIFIGSLKFNFNWKPDFNFFLFLNEVMRYHAVHVSEDKMPKCVRMRQQFQ